MGTFQPNSPGRHACACASRSQMSVAKGTRGGGLGRAAGVASWANEDVDAGVIARAIAFSGSAEEVEEVAGIPTRPQP